jgi:lipoprotein-releasing system permease protein
VLLELKLVSRFLFSRRRSLAKFTAVVAIAGLAAGVGSLIAAQALARGFQEEMQEKLLANAPHVAVIRADGTDIGNWRSLSAEIATVENVSAVTGAAAESIFLIGASISTPAVMRTSELADPAGITVGAELPERTGLVKGEPAEIVVLRNGTEPRRSLVNMTGVVKTGLFDQDSTAVFVSPREFARIYGDEEFTPRTLNVSVTEVYRSDETAGLIRQAVGDGFRVVDWQEANRPLFAALSLEKKVAFAIILLIVLIAVLNVTTTLALLVNERRLDIAVLRTCGATTKSLVLLFVFEGAVLGLVGIAAGTAVGLLACWAANTSRLISLPADVYSIAYVPLRPAAGDVLIVAAVTFCLCLLATFYPAFSASRVTPMENLRAQ